MPESNGNGENQKVTVAILGQKIDYLIKQDEGFHSDFEKWITIFDERLRKQETFQASATVQIANLQTEDKEICDEIKDLRGKTVARDTLAYISAVAAGALSFLIGNNK